MPLDHDRFMGLALEEARRSLAEGSAPVGSVIVKDGEVVGAGRNRVLSLRDPTVHAEVDAIRGACRRLGTANLSGCVLYSSLEPCPMCLWAIQLAQIGTLVLGARHRDLGRTDIGDYCVEEMLRLTKRQMELVTGVRAAECAAIRRDWTPKA